VPAPAPITLTGFGLVTPLGASSWATFAALLAGRSVGDALDPRAPDRDGAMARAGRVAVAVHDPSDPTVALAERAIREAVFEAGIPLAGLGTLLGSSKGAVGALETAARLFGPGDGRGPRGPHPPRPAEAVALGPHGFLAGRLAERTGIEILGHRVAACASGLAALAEAAARMRAPGGPDRLLVASAEASLQPLFVRSYDRLGVLARPGPETPGGGWRARPLCENRAGFQLAEAGAALVLEKREPQPGEPALVAAMEASDARHLVRPAPGLPALARILEQLTRLTPPRLVHVHAPGTRDHDPWEVALARRVAGADVDLYAAKGGIGHSLGASGLAALVIAARCARAGRRPPMPWIEAPLTGFGPIDPGPRALDPGAPQAVLAAGFGGHAAGALMAAKVAG